MTKKETTPEPTAAVPAVFKGILKVSEIMNREGVQKSRKSAGAGNFKYRSIDDVYQALSPALVECSLFIRLKNIEHFEASSTGKLRLVQFKAVYEVVSAEDGSTVEFCSLGEGADPSDKAASKALSYAFKTAACQLFCIPVEGTYDKNASQKPVPPPGPRTGEPARPAPAQKGGRPMVEELEKLAKDSARKGTQAFREFWEDLSDQEQTLLVELGIVEDCREIVRVADLKEDPV